MNDRGATSKAGHSWLWTVAAISALSAAGLLVVDAWGNVAWGKCDESESALCATGKVLTSFAVLGFLSLTVAMVLTGIVVGLDAGRFRRPFAHGRWIHVTVIGLFAPWALIAYVSGYGLGSLMPTQRRGRAVGLDPWQQARLGGWQEAVRLYAALAAGQVPPTVYAPDLSTDGAIHLDVPFQFSRFYGMDVTYEPGGMVAFGSSGFVAGAMIGRSIGNAIGYARAASLSTPKWRGQRPARVIVTATATWCAVEDSWLHFDHDGVINYQVDGDCCVLTYPDIPPVRLVGPSAWCHAVLFAYLRHGPSWQEVPFLNPVRDAAQQMRDATSDREAG